MTDLTNNVETLTPRPTRRRKAAAQPAETLPVVVPSDIAMVLGKLTGVVAGVENAVHDLKEDARRDRDEASTSRRRLYESIDDLKDKVHAIDLKVGRVLDVDGRLGQVDARLGQVEAEVVKVRRIRELSALIMTRSWKVGLGIAGVTAGGAAVWFWKHLVAAAFRIANLFM